MGDSPFTVFGVRHHGPGSARNLLEALEVLRPDQVLIEGPPDADAIVPLTTREGMKPPVALLVHARDDPQSAVFYPFAEFSPEWQALGYALRKGVPVRFMDLPQTHQLAIAAERRRSEEAAGDAEETEDAVEDPTPPAELKDAPDPGDKETESPDPGDPLDWFARHAGYEDGEAWWEHAVEERLDSGELFMAIADAMATLREQFPDRSTEHEQLRETRREAWMRKTIRSAAKEGATNLAVVCGAWHVPALLAEVKIKDDNEVLRGLPKTPVEATWVPWTYGRLARRSGYGAGVTAPGWYDHLWHTRRAGDGRGITGLTIRWLIEVARLLRRADLDASSAHVIEAVRLAESLASMRGRPFPGLEELNEATQSVLCFGESAPLTFIRERLLIRDRMGATPPETPRVPLHADIEKQQRNLRLKPSVSPVELDLDLRTSTGLARSHFLHRLALLGIPWGQLGETDARKKGTFHEYWTVTWDPEFSVSIIEASMWGSTVEQASAARAVDRARQATSVAACAQVIHAVILSELPTATEPVVSILRSRSAETSDVAGLMEALPSLVTILRYGNVRRSDSSMVGEVVDGFIARICIGLPPACSSLDDDAAADVAKRITGVHQAVNLVEDEAHQKTWTATLLAMVGSDTIHALVRGKIARLLFDGNALDGPAAARLMALAVSPGNDPPVAAAWIEGFLAGSGMLLIHDPKLWNTLDAWVADLSAERFMDVLPLIRRTFSTFSSPERHQLGQRAKTGRSHASTREAPPPGSASNQKTEWGDRAAQVILDLMGLPS